MRQFVSSVAPNSKGLLKISGKDFHYLKNVLRLSVGDMIPLSLEGGVLQDATVCKVDDGAKTITIQVCQNQNNCANGARNRASYALLQFIPKPQKMELIVRQAVECGIEKIIPVMGEYTQGGNEKPLQRPERFERIIREARQQSGSQVESKMYEPQTLLSALDMIEEENFFLGQESGGAAAKVFFFERSQKTVSLDEALFNGQKAAPRFCVFAVGSEGGISPSEFDLLLSRGFKAVHFNTNILRCETAALYAAAAIQSAIDN